MDRESLKLLADINRAVIQFRGLYAAWSKEHGISYHELLVLYTIRDQGFCTQKQICDSYLLPRQTMNHVILDLREPYKTPCRLVLLVYKRQVGAESGTRCRAGKGLCAVGTGKGIRPASAGGPEPDGDAGLGNFWTEEHPVHGKGGPFL